MYFNDDCALSLAPPPSPADPYVAAEDFLGTNNLPAHYLDQVAEFISQNAGEYQGSVGATQGADPFTGESRGAGLSVGATQGEDPFTGESRGGGT